jgi:hypothetical protein
LLSSSYVAAATYSAAMLSGRFEPALVDDPATLRQRFDPSCGNLAQVFMSMKTALIAARERHHPLNAGQRERIQQFVPQRLG